MTNAISSGNKSQTFIMTKMLSTVAFTLLFLS